MLNSSSDRLWGFFALSASLTIKVHLLNHRRIVHLISDTTWSFKYASARVIRCSVYLGRFSQGCVYVHMMTVAFSSESTPRVKFLPNFLRRSSVSLSFYRVKLRKSIIIKVRFWPYRRKDKVIDFLIFEKRRWRSMSWRELESTNFAFEYKVLLVWIKSVRVNLDEIDRK